MNRPRDAVPKLPPVTAWNSGDPLGQTLHAFRLRGVVYTRSHLTAPWGIELPAMPDCLLFHVVTRGQCRLEHHDAEAVTLCPGEFALFPRGQGHVIQHRSGAEVLPYFDLPIQQVCERYEVLQHGGGGEETTLICGAVRFDHPAAQQLIQLLPRLIHIRRWASAQSEWMQSTLRLIAAEAAGQQPGGETIVTRLADILVVQAIRAWLLEQPETRRGWLGALQHDRIGPALVGVHRDPLRTWTVESLAEAAAMSRSAFSACFTELLGESPMQYVTRWRMYHAGDRLRQDNLTAAECAAELGYNSEAAFSRAFKRVMKQTPGAYRRIRPDTNGHP
jgi:AraC-like DNA-binding protein